MESLGDILKRLGDTTRTTPAGRPEGYVPVEPVASTDACDVCGGRGWLTPEVPAGHADFGRVLTCQCQQERIAEERTARLVRYSNIGHLSRFTFETINLEGMLRDVASRDSFRQAHEAAVEYADAPDGWLVLSGPTGTGKTHLAAAIANRCIEKGKPVFFAHVPDLLDHLRASFGPGSEVTYSELFDQVRSTPMLVLDELEAQAGTPWAHEKLQQILNHRYNAQLATVVTTSSIDDLDPYVVTRLQSSGRVLSLRGKVVEPLHRLGRIEPEMMDLMTFEAFDVRGNDSDAEQQESLEEALHFSKAYAEFPHGWLTLFGETGVGKTHLAVAIAGERIKAGHPVFFAFVPELLDYLRYTFRPDSKVTYDRLFDEVKGAELLVLDDLGQEHSSPWAEEKLYQIIVHRHNARLPTVITSFLDFAKQSGPISSRIGDPSTGRMYRIDAPDYRPIRKESGRWMNRR